MVGTLANYLLNEAIVYGKAGPSSALCESQSLWLLVLEVIILGKFPNVVQVIGFSVGMIGGLFIAF